MRTGYLLAASLLVGALSWGTVSWGAEPTRINFLMDKDPELIYTDSPILFAKELKPLWLSALRHTEADVQRRAAQAFAKAHAQGMSGLADIVPDLVKVMEAKGVHPAARYATARAIIVLEARTEAERLFRLPHAEDPDLAYLIEPALAKWDYRPIREVWLQRLEDERVSRRARILAFRGLGQVGEARAAADLQKWALDPTAAADLRLEAANGLSQIQRMGLEPQARSMLAGTSSRRIVDRLVGIRLLQHHAGPATVELLQSVARDEEPAVAAAALNRLFNLSPDHTLAHAEWGAVHADSSIRQVALRTLAARPTPERIRLLATMLDDRLPQNRALVREFLIELAGEHRPDVLEGATTMLASDRWRGLEQAALVLGRLDHKPAADRLLELMAFPRKEVYVSSAWALRELALENTLPRILEAARIETEFRLKNQMDWDRDDWGGIVFEMFGKMQYAPARDVLVKYIPKSYAMGERSRASAIWALGHIYADKNPEDIAALLFERMTDNSPTPPEYLSVKMQSTVALGRMGSKQYVDTIRQSISLSADWALERLTGERRPPPTIPERYAGPWFLEPLPQLDHDLK